MLTLKEVEYSIKFYGVVELGGEFSFPIGMTRDQAYGHLHGIACQTGGMVALSRTVANEQLLVYPPNEPGYWLLTWRDEGLQVARYMPETQTFPRTK